MMNIKKNLLLISDWLLFFVMLILILIECIFLIQNYSQQDLNLVQHNSELTSIKLYADGDNASQDAATSAHYKAIEIGVTAGVLGTIIIVLLIIYFIKKKRETL